MAKLFPPFTWKTLCIKISFVLCFLLGSSAIYAQEIPLDGDQAVANIYDHVLGVEGQFDLSKPADARIAEEAFTRQSSKIEAKLSILPADRWWAVALTNVGDEAGRWRLDQQWIFAAAIEVYLIQNGQPIKVMETGEAIKGFSKRIVPQRRLVSTYFTLQPGESATLWIKHQQDYPRYEKLSLQSEHSYVQAIYSERLAIGLYYGFCAAMVVFFGLFGAILGFRPAFNYALFFFILICLNLAATGYLMEYFHPEDGSLFPIILLCLQGACAIGHLEFIKAFVFPGKPPKFFHHISICFYIYIVIIVIGDVFWDTESTGISVGVASVIGVLVTLVCLAFGIRNKVSGIALLVIGYLAYMSVSLIGGLNAAGLLPFDLVLYDITVRTLHLIDALIFGLAVVIQALALRRQRDQARNAELEAFRDRDQARRLAERHRERLATTSHDLRQPLTSLQLALEQADSPSPELKKKLATGLEYLNSVLGTTLKDARPDGHGSEIFESSHGTVPVQIIFDNLDRMFGAEAKQKGLALELQPTDVALEVDIVGLIRMLSNLISNAIKYTEKGHVKVRCLQNGESVSIEVADSGIGLSAAALSRVMKPYQRNSDNMNGEGLGLHIVSTIAEQTGLTLEADSHPGTGTTVRLVGFSIHS